MSAAQATLLRRIKLPSGGSDGPLRSSILSRWGGLLDLDPAGRRNRRGGRRSWSAFRADDGEDQVAWRDGMRRVARLVSPPPPAAGTRLRSSQIVSYLVTGGLGGIGLAIADWLVARGARHLCSSDGRRCRPAGLGDAFRRRAHRRCHQARTCRRDGKHRGVGRGRPRPLWRV